MKPITLAVLLTFISIGACAQQGSKLYRAKILLRSNSSRTCIVTAFGDTAVQIVKVAEAKSGGVADRLTSEWLPVSNIREMRFRKLNALKSGVIGGAVIGLVMGGVIGNLSYKPCDPAPIWLGGDCWEVMDRGESTLFGALMGVQIGAGIGILIGTANKKFVINGSQQTYEKSRKDLDKYVMRQPGTR